MYSHAHIELIRSVQGLGNSVSTKKVATAQGKCHPDRTLDLAAVTADDLHASAVIKVRCSDVQACAFAHLCCALQLLRSCWHCLRGCNSYLRCRGGCIATNKLLLFVAAQASGTVWRLDQCLSNIGFDRNLQLPSFSFTDRMHVLPLHYIWHLRCLPRQLHAILPLSLLQLVSLTRVKMVHLHNCKWHAQTLCPFMSADAWIIIVSLEYVSICRCMLSTLAPQVKGLKLFCELVISQLKCTAIAANILSASCHHVKGW